MKKLSKLFLFLFTALLISACGDSDKKENKDDDLQIGDYNNETPAKTTPAKNTADMEDFSNKGIGPVKSVTLNEDIDQALATRGQQCLKICALPVTKLTRNLLVLQLKRYLKDVHLSGL